MLFTNICMKKNRSHEQLTPDRNAERANLESYCSMTTGISLRFVGHNFRCYVSVLYTFPFKFKIVSFYL